MPPRLEPDMQNNGTAMQRVIHAIVSKNDLVLATLIVCIIFMMILPLPLWLVDALIALNMCISAVLLMVAMYLPSPLAFSSFPSVLLVTTLFRLAIGIATTRLILLNADAGHIVYTFGNFVVGGNLVVGLVVFLILTVVQFVVITKGAERVAEVGARFSLDAMPGKQMSIDGDMRAGVIDMDEARRRRTLVEKESQLYGSMDGAMKFVKGDAIAGIIIVAVNLLGGILIGTLQRGMSAGEAMKVYTVLVEGDDMTEPVADETRSILDGHIILSRRLGAANHYPAIDVLASASRVMNALIAPEHRAAAGRVRELMAKYQEIELLLKVGEYKKGADRVADLAIERHAAIQSFLRQRTDEHDGFDSAVAKLGKLAA
jgi:type III secretory pathway component EscV